MATLVAVDAGKTDEGRTTPSKKGKAKGTKIPSKKSDGLDTETDQRPNGRKEESKTTGGDGARVNSGQTNGLNSVSPKGPGESKISKKKKLKSTDQKKKSALEKDPKNVTNERHSTIIDVRNDTPTNVPEPIVCAPPTNTAPQNAFYNPYDWYDGGVARPISTVMVNNDLDGKAVSKVDVTADSQASPAIPVIDIQGMVPKVPQKYRCMTAVGSTEPAFDRVPPLMRPPKVYPTVRTDIPMVLEPRPESKSVEEARQSVPSTGNASPGEAPTSSASEDPTGKDGSQEAKPISEEDQQGTESKTLPTAAATSTKRKKTVKNNVKPQVTKTSKTNTAPQKVKSEKGKDKPIVAVTEKTKSKVPNKAEKRDDEVRKPEQKASRKLNTKAVLAPKKAVPKPTPVREETTEESSSESSSESETSESESTSDSETESSSESTSDSSTASEEESSEKSDEENPIDRKGSSKAVPKVLEPRSSLRQQLESERSSDTESHTSETSEVSSTSTATSSKSSAVTPEGTAGEETNNSGATSEDERSSSSSSPRPTEQPRKLSRLDQIKRPKRYAMEVKDAEPVAPLAKLHARPQLMSLFCSKVYSSNPDLWSKPTGLAISREGNFIITDYMEGNVKLFNKTGQLKVEFGEGCLKKPWNTMILRGEELAVSDPGDCSVKIFTRDGKFLRRFQFQEFNEPYGMARGSLGEVLVGDRGADGIHVFYQDGSMQGTLETRDGQPFAAWPRYMTVDKKGNIIISDSESHSVRIFTSAGELTAEHGGLGRGTAQLMCPRGVCVDRFGHVLVADHENSRIKMLSPEGAFIRNLITKEQGLQNPEALAVDKDGQLVVTEGSSGEVKIFAYVM